MTTYLHITPPSNMPNGHGNCATPDNETCHDRFPLPSPLPEGEGDRVSLREFHVNPGLSGMRSDRAFATVFKGTRWWLPMLAFFWFPCASGVSLSDPTLPHPAWLAIHQPPPAAENLTQQEATSKARLTIVGESRKFAIVDGQLVKPGDNYKGSRVLDIKAGEVVMQNKSKSLQVNPLINKKPVSTLEHLKPTPLSPPLSGGSL